MRSIFGWSYPPGAASDPFAPYNQEDEVCLICGVEAGLCECPECPVCGVVGDPNCIKNHGLKLPDISGWPFKDEK